MVLFRANLFSQEDMADIFGEILPAEGDAWASYEEASRPESPWNSAKLNAEADRERKQKNRQDQEDLQFHWSSPIVSAEDQEDAKYHWSSPVLPTTYHNDNGEEFEGSHADSASYYNNQYQSTNATAYHGSSFTSQSTNPRSPYVEDYYGDSSSSTFAEDREYQNFANSAYNAYQKQGQGSTSFNTNHAGGSSTNFGQAWEFNEDDLEELDFANMFTDEAQKPKSPKMKQTHSTPIDDFIDAYIQLSREKARLLVVKEHRTVTKSDIVRWKLPTTTTGLYWDPDERPIKLCSEAFDAFSLGRWIYDWSEVYKGVNSEITETAEDLWSFLVQLSNKLKLAREALKLIKKDDDLDTVKGFVESGDRVMRKLQKILKCAQGFMYDPADKPCSRCKPLAQQKAGMAFIDAFFTDEDLSARVDKLLYSMRTWNFRYDVNCKEIVAYFFR